MRNLIATIGLASLIVAGAMTWNMPQSRAEASDMLPAFTVTNVSDVLTEMGATGVTSGTIQGLPYINFSDRGLSYMLVLTVCDAAKSNCKGIRGVILFEPANYSHQTINNFNKGYAFGKAYITDQGGLMSERYFIADKGIPKQNVVSEIANFVGMTPKLLEFIKNAGVVASVQGQTRTLSYRPSAAKPVDAVHGGAGDAVVHLAPLNRLN